MMTRTEIETRLTEKATKDAAFRAALLHDPKATIEEEIGAPLPAAMRVDVLEESDDQVFLVLPPAIAQPEVMRPLTESELEVVAGGRSGGSNSLTCCVCWLWSIIK